MAEGMLPSTVQIKNEWWEPQDKRIVSAVTAATTLLDLTHTDTKGPDATTTKEEPNLCLVSLFLTKLVYPLLKPTFLYPTTAYFFIEAMAVAMKLSEAVQPLLTWIQVCLVDVAPGISSLGALVLEDCLASRRRKTSRDIALKAPQMQPENTTYVMQAALCAPMPPSPSKKAAAPSERWDLQKIALRRLYNANGLDYLPKMWRILAPLKK